MTWMTLIHLGDLSLVLPAAAALTAWLLGVRAWRMALWWSVLFALGMGLVGVSKIAFMGWGSGLPALDFKALSGHATGVTAVLPLLFFLLLKRRGARLRAAGVATGLVLGVLMAVLLVAFGQHTPVEAMAGWSIGATVSVSAIRLAGELPPAPPSRALPCVGLVFLGSALLIQSLPVGYWMIRVALALSGNVRPFAWDAGC